MTWRKLRTRFVKSAAEQGRLAARMLMDLHLLTGLAEARTRHARLAGMFYEMGLKKLMCRRSIELSHVNDTYTEWVTQHYFLSGRALATHAHADWAALPVTVDLYYY